MVTPLIDLLRYPAAERAQLFLRRWAVEIFFRDVQITLGMGAAFPAHLTVDENVHIPRQGGPRVLRLLDDLGV